MHLFGVETVKFGPGVGASYAPQCPLLLTGAAEAVAEAEGQLTDELRVTRCVHGEPSGSQQQAQRARKVRRLPAGEPVDERPEQFVVARQAEGIEDEPCRRLVEEREKELGPFGIAQGNHTGRRDPDGARLVVQLFADAPEDERVLEGRYDLQGTEQQSALPGLAVAEHAEHGVGNHFIAAVLPEKGCGGPLQRMHVAGDEGEHILLCHTRREHVDERPPLGFLKVPARQCLEEAHPRVIEGAVEIVGCGKNERARRCGAAGVRCVVRSEGGINSHQRTSSFGLHRQRAGGQRSRRDRRRPAA